MQKKLQDYLGKYLGKEIKIIPGVPGQLTIEIPAEKIRATALVLRDEKDLDFAMLIDLCGVDYLHYGVAQWDTTTTTTEGFSRAVTEPKFDATNASNPRFAVVYNLLSLTHNWRLRLRVFLEASQLSIDSVVAVWPAANWFEREAFDLFGIQFKGHPDLRRILTDYCFIGHPLRKDFPLVGHNEMRYDATLGSCVYEKNLVKERVVVPKVIRDDNRYRSETD